MSSTTDGTVFAGRSSDETLAPFLPPGGDGRTTAVGLEVDDDGHLWVAGGGTGLVFVYDAGTGGLIAKLSAGSAPTFINDIAIDRDQGPVILMIENFQSGLPWRLMRRSPHVVRGLLRAGFRNGWLEGEASDFPPAVSGEA